MKTKIFMSMLVIALMAALVGGATMAWFTDEDTTNDRAFAAGTLDVFAGDQVITVPIGNMAPGDEIYGVFTVHNHGSLDLKYRTNINAAGGLFLGLPYTGQGHRAIVTITHGGTGTLAAGGGTANVYYTIALPEHAGNAYQGATGTLFFTVQATQPANPGWGQQ